MKKTETNFFNYRVPITTRCARNQSSVYSTVANSYAFKTDKFISFQDTQNIVFDVHGVWLEQSVIQNLFRNTPSFMKDYHEDEEQSFERETPC